MINTSTITPATRQKPLNPAWRRPPGINIKAVAFIALAGVAIVFASLGMCHHLGFVSHICNHIPPAVYKGILFGASICALVALCYLKKKQKRVDFPPLPVEGLGQEGEKCPLHPEEQNTLPEGKVSKIRPETLEFLMPEGASTIEECLSTLWVTRQDWEVSQGDRDDRDGRIKRLSVRYGTSVMPGELKPRLEIPGEVTSDMVQSYNKKSEEAAVARAKALQVDLEREDA